MVDANDEVRALLAENARLRELNATQADAIAALTARVAELERRLRMDSTNSSKPPSSDGYAKKPNRAQRRAEGRRQGKQPGAPGAHLAALPTPDAVVTHRPECCGDCGADLADAPVEGVEARQVFELPPTRLVVTEHRAERRRCRCGRPTKAAFPEGVAAPTQYGPGVRALVAYLCAHQHLPCDRTAQLLADCFSAPVSTGSIVNMVAECAEGLAPFDDAVADRIASSPVAHFDETGARVAGTLHWVHSASTAGLTRYGVHPRRGKDGMEAAGVLPRFGGTAVHDGYPPYRHFGCAHALCNAHHLRELAAAAEIDGQGWAADMAELLVELGKTVDRARAAGAEGLPADVLRRYRRRYRRIVAAGRAANPPPTVRTGRRGPIARSPAANLLARLDTRQDEVLRFAADFAVPFDNNRAERDIRMVKLQQKISGCWRTTSGAERFLVVRGYVSTLRKQSLPVLDSLRQVFEGNPWMPPPLTT